MITAPHARMMFNAKMIYHQRRDQRETSNERVQPRTKLKQLLNETRERASASYDGETSTPAWISHRLIRITLDRCANPRERVSLLLTLVSRRIDCTSENTII